MSHHETRRHRARRECSWRSSPTSVAGPRRGIRRNLRPLLVILATDQHANLTGEVTFHLENTAQGAQVVVASAPAVTTTPAREVREHAKDVAGALQLPLPHLAAWMRAHLTPDAQEVAA